MKAELKLNNLLFESVNTITYTPEILKVNSDMR